jgi:hypothetical protein
MDLGPHPRFEAKQVNDLEWVVHDLTYDESDPRRVIAHIWQADLDEYEVTWVRGLALDRWYHSVHSVLEDVVARMPNRTKPIPIPHRPPAGAHLAVAV